MFAVTVDGTILLNARALDDVDLAELAQKRGTFVGVPVTAKEVQMLSERVYDASSEAAAFISGTRRKKNRKK